MSRPIDGDALILHLTTCQYNGMPTNKFYAFDDVIHHVKTMPTITPERKTGRWEDCGVNGWRCSNCRYEVARYNNTAFCPYCGSYNGGQEE